MVEGLFRRRCFFFQAVSGDVCLRQVKLFHSEVFLRKVMFALWRMTAPCSAPDERISSAAAFSLVLSFLVKEKEHRPSPPLRTPVPVFVFSHISEILA